MLAQVKNAGFDFKYFIKTIYFNFYFLKRKPNRHFS